MREKFYYGLFLVKWKHQSTFSKKLFLFCLFLLSIVFVMFGFSPNTLGVRIKNTLRKECAKEEENSSEAKIKNKKEDNEKESTTKNKSTKATKTTMDIIIKFNSFKSG